MIAIFIIAFIAFSIAFLLLSGEKKTDEFFPMVTVAWKQVLLRRGPFFYIHPYVWLR